MQVAKEDKVVHWDWLDELKREKMNGEIVAKGSKGGFNVLQIFEGNQGHFLRVVCKGQELLNANIHSWPARVSEDGLTIELWLFDNSLGRDLYKRKFFLTFFEERAALLFFESYTNALSFVKDGYSYWDMKHGTAGNHLDGESDECASKEEDGEEETGVEELVELLDNGPVKIESVAAAGDDSFNEREELQLLLEIEANIGQSQDLFNPYYPSQCD